MTEAKVQTADRVDPTTVEGWVRSHGPAMLAYLTRLVGRRDRAEDCFQETFRRAVEKGGRVNPAAARAWLYRVATHVALDGFRRRRRRRTQPLGAELRDAGPGPAEQLARGERRAAVRAAVAALPDRQRAVLVLAYFEKRPYREIAELLGCSVGAVKTHMSRALAALARRLPPPE